MADRPIKRNRHLQPLSREHHFGLLFCWKIRQGIKLRVDSGRITRYVQAFWHDNLYPHFKEEETLLFHDKSDSFVQKAVEEHLLIQAQVQEIIHAAEMATPQELNNLTDTIDNHIRYEERMLFPHLERVFTEAQWRNIDACLQDAITVQLKHNYPDEFWRDPRSSL